jgi:hypothetical protein
MIESNAVSSPSSPEGKIHSDLRRVDAHVIQPEEYEEIPEIAEEDLTLAVIKRPGQPDQSFLKAQAHES